jgi:hypothetical protein
MAGGADVDVTPSPKGGNKKQNQKLLQVPRTSSPPPQAARSFVVNFLALIYVFKPNNAEGACACPAAAAAGAH